jgi:serine/threonine protein kinase/hemoglobin-like flavoprotein
MNVGDVRNRVFVSYAHEDIEMAEDFRKHLAVRLRAEAPVWIDTEIRAGERWENALNDALHASSCALLLLSVDFLNSDYIGTKELPGILQEARRGLRVVPVVVRECAWDAIPDLQCLQHARPPAPCLASLREHSPSEYESAIESVCKIVAGYVGQLGRQSRAETLSRVPDVLSKIEGLSITGAKRGGDYTVVYRGEMQGRDVAVKVMFGMTLGELRAAFKAALAVAKNVEHHCFVPILHERVEDDDAPPIVVSPWIDSTQLLHRVAQEPLPIDRVAMFLRRASDALAMLHEQNGIYGVLTPDNVWVEERLKILRFPAVGIYGFLSIHQPWHKALGHKADAATHLIPEQYFGQALSPRSDQYGLAQLAVQMLCGKAPVTVTRPADLEEKRRFFDAPADFLRMKFPHASWQDDHPEFAEILFRMLQSNPDNRWPGLKEVGAELRRLEDEACAIAKASYRELAKDDTFFAAFYTRFFERCPGARAKFQDPEMEKQAEKLKIAMAALLNFRDGAEPTTLYWHVPVHAQRGVTVEEYDHFEQSLLQCLTARYGDGSKQVAAWSKLLPPVMDYMKRNCLAQRA